MACQVSFRFPDGRVIRLRRYRSRPGPENDGRGGGRQASGFHRPGGSTQRGALSTAWTFLHWDGKDAKLKYTGVKSVDGKDAHTLDYQPKRGSGTMKITMYFDAETFRHIRTVYKVTVPRGIGATPDQSPLLREQRYTIEEIFEGFQQVDGLVLPTRWTVQYTYDGQSGTTILEWRAQVERVQTNGELTEAAFKLE